MASKHAAKAIEQFFFKGGATQALFRWLDFRLFVSQKNTKLTSSNDINSASHSATDYLKIWQQQTSLTTPATGILRLLAVIAVVIGFTAMAGVLNVREQAFINIWVPLGLFAFLPLLLTLSSFYFSFLSPAKSNLHHHPLLHWLINKLHLQQFIPYKNLLLPWLFWQLQSAAILFSASALLSFFILATFQDYLFGWSSTLITDSATMTQLMTTLSWPWHWLIDTPSAELIQQTRFSAQASDLAVSANNVWWMTLVMAIVVYGILPRLLLALLLRQQFIRYLRSNIQNSGDVEQFIVAQQHQVSRNPIQSDNNNLTSNVVSLPTANTALISWQQADLDFPIDKQLGTDDWLKDEQWLNSTASQFDKPVWIIIDPMQTPTGELADCIELLQQHNEPISLVLYPVNTDDARYQQQQKSWQFFAQRHAITLKEGHAHV
ncbi:DUF2868 domain-containing protein [Methylophaga sulfidovorans]|uniref:DUF2868 domain-containing protein n=1 Tax=Methylophaga sulfidovorans TaxID=45496 RepID=A0A1I3XZG9_9GAMM|nr:DUF2868 domain-containing protein [Methylophaga sulfidovorans]SFK24451.1 Protein of unknown function [Methylophaga sulfidovorans]